MTGKSQHGFKAKHSTMNAGIKQQSLIARALKDNKYAMMSSMDLSSAFDVENVGLLIKTLEIIGLSYDIILIFTEWLISRYCYISTGKNEL